MLPFPNGQLGSYRLIRRIGGGGMGEVYLAEDERMGITRQVAIKTIRAEVDPYPDQAATKDAERLFRREMQAITRLDHPFILPLYDFGEERVEETMLTYMVMPFRPEGSLANWLQKRGATRPLSLEEMLHFVRQTAQALQHAHEHGLIHQDVKPANFLLRDRSDQALPDLLLADFGIVKIATATAMSSQSIRGTPAYMAPEQWRGQPVLATDQYALAIMAYLLLTRHYPFTGRMEQVMHQHLTVQPPTPSTFNPAITPYLDEVLLHTLRKAPEKRFAAISAFASAFQQAIHHSAPSASPPPVLPSPAEQVHVSPIPPAEAAVPFPSSGVYPAPIISPKREPSAPRSAPAASLLPLQPKKETPRAVPPRAKPPTYTPTIPPVPSKWPPPPRPGTKNTPNRLIGVFATVGVVVLLILACIVGVAIYQNQTSTGHATGLQTTTGIAGQTWHTQSSSTSQGLFGVVWSGSQFVAVGNSGTILTSSDGSTWTAQSSGTTQDLSGVVWSGSRFVAVGTKGAILTSPNESTWTVQSSGTSQSLWGVAWSGSQFVAIGDTILTSP